MNHTAIDTLAWLIEQAYEGDPAQSLLVNLRELRDDDWTALPPGCARSVSDILEHVGWCKWMYEDYAFGSRTLRGDIPPLVPTSNATSRPRIELLPWLAEGHSRWLNSVKALADDTELDRKRYANWGELLPTRDLIRIMIGHDFYHAGEINHIRAVLQDTDRWPYEQD